MPTVIVDESLLMDDWFFTEATDDDHLPVVQSDVVRWLVTAGAVSSLLVAALTLSL